MIKETNLYIVEIENVQFAHNDKIYVCAETIFDVMTILNAKCEADKIKSITQSNSKALYQIKAV